VRAHIRVGPSSSGEAGRAPIAWSRAVSCAALRGLAIIITMPETADSPADAPLGADTLANALAVTRTVERARIELRTTVAGAGNSLTFVHRGAFVQGGARVQAESDMTEAAAALAAAGQPMPGDWSHPTRIVVDGETVYSQLGPMAEALGREPTDWTSAGLLAVMAQGATDNDALALALDPLGPLDLLERRVVEIGEGDGEDEIGGVRAVHLRATLALAGETSDGATEPSAGSFEGRLRAAGVETLPVDVWVDRAGVVRRLMVRLDASLAGGSAESSLTTTFDVYDVGENLEVEVPDPADVIAT
jgi:hypothetical protein